MESQVHLHVPFLHGLRGALSPGRGARQIGGGRAADAVIRQQDKNHKGARDIPEFADESVPQQLLMASACANTESKEEKTTNAENRRIRLLVRIQHRRNGGRGGSGRGRKERARRGVLRRLSVYVFRRGPEARSRTPSRNITLRASWCAPALPACTRPPSARPRQAAGLNPYMVEIANIREQCSWIHKDMEEATEKAIVLAQGRHCQGAANDAPLQAGDKPGNQARALVIGGGIAGIQTALDVADAGYEVDIVEKQPTIGGQHGSAGQDLPHPGLRGLHSHPQDGGSCAERKDQHLSPTPRWRRFPASWATSRSTIRKKARYRGRDQVHGLRRLCTEQVPLPQGHRTNSTWA